MYYPQVTIEPPAGWVTAADARLLPVVVRDDMWDERTTEVEVTPELLAVMVLDVPNG